MSWTSSVSESLKLPRSAEVVVSERERWMRLKLFFSDVTSAAFVSSFIPRVSTRAQSERRAIRELTERTGGGTREQESKRERAREQERESKRTRLRLVNFLRWSSNPTAIGRYMKACRAPSTCQKATTEEDLSRIDTLAWTYPKVGKIICSQFLDNC